MCTVTYLPRPSGFILTHNRDEAPSRSPQSIVLEKTPLGESLLFPRDIKAGGTWIATSRYGRTACLLNGAFVKHHHAPPYRRSRGLILLDFFDWKNPDEFFQRYDFEGVEPFTFLFFEQGQAPGISSQRATEFRWDGQQRYLKNLQTDQPHFWCSATLYPPEMQIRREQVFKDWLVNHPPYNQSGNQNTANLPITHLPIESIPQSPNRINSPIPQSLISLHLRGSVNDPENDYVMNRAGKVQTVSLTQVIVDKKNARMRYFDLLGGNRSERRLTHGERTA